MEEPQRSPSVHHRPVPDAIRYLADHLEAGTDPVVVIVSLRMLAERMESE